MTAPTGALSRRAALQLLDAVLRRGQPLEAALPAATRPLSDPADRALARSIASNTLRWLPDLDALIDGATRQRLPDDAKARMVLRLALAQALILETPHHAVVATALALVDGGPKRLVHGVLGNLLRNGVTLPETPTLPEDVAVRWEAQWGLEMVASARQSLVKPPPVDLTLRDPRETDAWAARLSAEILQPGHLRLPAGVTVPSLPGFVEGAWWVQNVAAAFPVSLLGPGLGRDALDLCAAPGGKTMQLAANGWCVTAVDSDRRRMERVTENLSRTGLEAELVIARLEGWKPDRQWPAILLDAPCSATGIFQRHPEVLHRARPRDIDGFAQTQSAMLTRAAQWLEPGGTLIYATCSLEPAEGEDQIAGGEQAGLALKAQYRLQPVPGRDGFFVAHFERA